MDGNIKSKITDMNHELKLLSKYFLDVADGKKSFELRKDDRDYKVGDTLKLKEWTGKQFTGSYSTRLITYVLRDCPQYGLKKGFVILGMY